jgi:uncharacterized protein YutE (UPF0331/DUF86 family)
MMSESQLWESNILRNLQHVSEARGLKFYVNPSPEVIPAFLGDYQPDAIAVGPDGGIIVEMKTRRNPASERQLAAIAKRVSDQKGWEFRVIYLNPPVEGVQSIAKPTHEQLQAKLGEIEALTKVGQPAAALVAAWAVLESLARLATSNSQERTSKGFSPLQAVQTLAEEGYIENDAADRLREMVKLRNAVVHGDFSVDVPAEQVDSLLKLLQGIASDIMSATPESAR